MELEEIMLPAITLEWSDWTAWDVLSQDARTHPTEMRIPDAPGVYEAKLRQNEDCLTIGKAANLRMRVKQ